MSTLDDLLRLVTVAGGSNPDPTAIGARSSLPPQGPAYGPPAPAIPGPPLSPQDVADRITAARAVASGSVPSPGMAPSPRLQGSTQLSDSLGPPGILERTIGRAAPAGGIFGLLNLVAGLARGGDFPSADAAKRRGLDALQANLDQQARDQSAERAKYNLGVRVKSVQDRLNEIDQQNSELRLRNQMPGMSQDIADQNQARIAVNKNAYNKLQGVMASLVGGQPVEDLTGPEPTRDLPATQADVTRIHAKAEEEGRISGLGATSTGFANEIQTTPHDVKYIDMGKIPPGPGRAATQAQLEKEGVRVLPTATAAAVNLIKASRNQLLDLAGNGAVLPESGWDAADRVANSIEAKLGVGRGADLKVLDQSIEAQLGVAKSLAQGTGVRSSTELLTQLQKRQGLGPADTRQILRPRLRTGLKMLNEVEKAIVPGTPNESDADIDKLIEDRLSAGDADRAERASRNPGSARPNPSAPPGTPTEVDPDSLPGTTVIPVVAHTRRKR